MKISIRRSFCVISAAIMSVAVANGQAFVSTHVQGLRGAMFGDVVLADYDADGFLDVLIAGTELGASQPGIRLYRNEGPKADGSWSFTDTFASFPDASRYLNGTRASSVAAGDFDNDGDIDFLVTGGGGTVIYRNDGHGRFSALPIHEETSPARESAYVDVVTTPSSAWGDYDNDGDLDVLIASRTGSYIYRNDGNSRFTRIEVNLPSLPNAIVSWGDYDNDGDLDILAVSRPFQGSPPRTRIFRNDGGTFVDIRAILPGIEGGSVSWGDFDNDGDLDLLITSRLPTYGSIEGVRLPTGLYRNDGGVYRHTGDALPAAWHGVFLDYDGDGDLDILLNGVQAIGTFAQVIRNDDGKFAHRSELFPGVWFGSIATGDIDGDGRTDVIMSGRFQSGRTFLPRVLFYRNGSAGRRDPPQSPHTLGVRQVGETMVLTWHAPAQPWGVQQEAYTYNVRVGTTPGGSDVLSPLSLPRGHRLVSAAGNAGHSHRLILRGLTPSERYFWTVQSVDNRNVASPFAAENWFVATTSGPGSPAAPPIYTDNYPNPFNPATTIRFSLQSPAPVRVRVYNVLGTQIASIYDAVASAGDHEAVWDGHDANGVPAASGVYFYAIETPEHRATRRMLLLK